MSNTVQNGSQAWEPLTPRGVASFARASIGRLWFVQLIVAALAAATIGWFFNTSIFPVVRQAIQQLPLEGEIRFHQLSWSGDSPLELAESHLLGIAVDLDHTGRIGREPNFQIEFGRDDLRVFGLLGEFSFDYPSGWRVGFNRKELEPWWGAREPGMLMIITLATIVGLMICWTVLATLYFVPIKIISFFQNRDLQWRGSWKLAGAAQMPGALFFTCVVVAFTLNWFDLIGLAGFAVIHLLIGWLYLFVSPLFLSRDPLVAPATTNPFIKEGSSQKGAVPKNPFSKSPHAEPEQSQSTSQPAEEKPIA
ncbi:hypothetical protein [Pedosphaera parvula]|uniref:Uncharacterized protein n=1 Tax=Pedosphaera parvula (strain Ellin514) TaxID=320771 RepID=B9XS57_PEDPL|nr:hypothetical protein [Pedosphaera parvula]EEF57312.1 hypothetical protein Cflav_PD0321 [Pedosphaera parvula Ellin514]